MRWWGGLCCEATLVGVFDTIGTFWPLLIALKESQQHDLKRRKVEGKIMVLQRTFILLRLQLSHPLLDLRCDLRDTLGFSALLGVEARVIVVFSRDNQPII
jgi:hypothetical protein